MESNYAAYPVTATALAAEIKKVCNDYKSQKVNEAQIHEVLSRYAKTLPTIFYDAKGGYNPTLIRVCGSTRMTLVDAVLKGERRKG